MLDVLYQFMQDNHALLWWLLSGSIIALVVALVAVAWTVVHLPEDYFLHPERTAGVRQSWPTWLRYTLRLAQNGIGLLLVILGLIMLITPGQGLLTLLIGIMLMNFPGKYRLERWIVSRPAIWSTINHWRERWHKPRLKDWR